MLDYLWSSVAGGYALPARQRPAWFQAGDGLASFQCADTAAGRRAWVGRLDRRALEEPRGSCGVPATPAGDARRSHLRRGWYWGSQAFAEKMVKLGDCLLRQRRSGADGLSLEPRAHGEQEAERLLRAGLAQAGWTPAECRRLPGSDARKVALAAKIWDQTTVNQSWIAEKLGMRSAGNVCQQIRRHCQRPIPPLAPA